MALSLTWYRSQYSPQDATSVVGGNIDTGAPITGSLDEIFELGYSLFLGRTPYQRFRKVFAKNTGAIITDAVAYWQSLENTSELRFALATDLADTSTNSATMPSGYDTGDFYGVIGLGNAVDIPDIAGSTGVVGFWIWQYIPNGLDDETGTLGELAIAGNQ